MIKGILFDFDGVLFNTELHYFKKKLEYLDYVGSPLPKERMKLFICSDASIDIYDEVLKGYEDIIDKVEFKKSMKEFLDTRYPRYIGTPFKELIFEDVKPILKWLKENGYKIACASKSNLDYIREGLEQTEIIDYFDVITSGANFTRNKPDPECYLYCMNQCGLNRDECLIVEDSPNGIKAARNAGIKVVVRKEYGIGLDQRGADYYVDTYDELPAIIADINNI